MFIKLFYHHYRRHRNKENSRFTRLRKKIYVESLVNEILALKETRSKLVLRTSSMSVYPFNIWNVSNFEECNMRLSNVF